MSENNPYAAPSSNIERDSALGEATLLAEPRSLPAGRGWGWIQSGFAYFNRSKGGWILGTIVGGICLLLLMIIPLLGPLIYMLVLYVLVGGVMLGCHAQSQGEPFEVRYVFAGFKNPTKLIILSIVMSLLSLVVMVAIMGPPYIWMMANPSDPEKALEVIGSGNSFLLTVLLSMLVLIPISMAVWFAPALIVINDMSVVQALKTSFNGCLKNLLPFLVFGLIGTVFYLLAIIPIALGLLVFLPTFTAATYVAYREIFTESV